MQSELKILFVEDLAEDAELILLHLRRNGFQIQHEMVSTESELERALEKQWDTVICDYNLPGYNAVKAISLVKSRRPELPTIVVSGSVGEEVAVETMRSGASDYVMKHNLLRLIPAIERGLKDRNLFLEGQQIEAALKKTEEDLRQAQKLEALGQLAGGIAHDFNNIMAAILMQVELLLEKTEEDGMRQDDPLRAGLERIREAGERARNLTRHLLGFSRKQVLQSKIISLNDLVTDMGKMLRPILEENIELRVALASDLKNIKADPSHIEQIILNLVVNSRDAMPQGGVLAISTRNVVVSESVAKAQGIAPGAYAMLEVKDTGIGISPAVKHRLFEPFFTTKPVGKGTGLGLSTVYGIVKQSGGAISLDSIEGNGTTFTIYLPQVEQAIDPATPAAPEITFLGGTETILFVEDESDLQEIVCKILETNGYRVLTATNGVLALEVLKSYPEPIHLVITDVIMPEMGGAELASACQQLRKDTKFLFQSGYTEDILVLNGIRAGTIHFLEKPYGRKALLAKIRSILAPKQK